MISLFDINCWFKYIKIYFFNRNYVNITLTIKPGTILHLKEGVGIRVVRSGDWDGFGNYHPSSTDGHLIAVGTPDSLITITSSYEKVNALQFNLGDTLK